jgi:uncharacterized iron-regulated protein
MRTLHLIDFDTLVHNLATAHLIALGEEHYHSEIQAFELRLLKALAQQRPHQLALAMEFLERDAQETVDAYLAHTIDQETLHTRLNASAAFQRLGFHVILDSRFLILDSIQNPESRIHL